MRCNSAEEIFVDNKTIIVASTKILMTIVTNIAAVLNIMMVYYYNRKRGQSNSIYATDPLHINVTGDKETPFNMIRTKCIPILMNYFLHYVRHFGQRKSSQWNTSWLTIAGRKWEVTISLPQLPL